MSTPHPSYANLVRQNAALERELADLRINSPHYRGLCEDFETLLPPHPHVGSSGGWLDRLKSLRESALLLAATGEALLDKKLGDNTHYERAALHHALKNYDKMMNPKKRQKKLRDGDSVAIGVIS